MAIREMSSNVLTFYLIVLFALFANVCAKEYVPVLLWESSATGSEDVGSRPALTKWPTDEFADYIAKKVNSYKEKPLIVVFSEENLSIEDFSWHDVSEQGSFPQLESLTKKSTRVNFFPSVHAPLRAIKDLVNDGYAYKTVDLNNNKNAPVTADDGTVLLIKLEDPESTEDRPTFLSRHDKIIKDIYTELLSKHPRILAVYTGRYASFLDTDPEPIHRVRRLLAETNETAKAPAEGDSKLWRDKDSKVFMYFAGPYPTLTSDNTSQELKTYTDTPTIDERDNLQRFIVTFAAQGRKITLRFRFPMSRNSYWSLPTIEYEESGKTLWLESASEPIEAPNNFSYHCRRSMFFKNGSVTLNLTDVQIEPRLQKPMFSDSYDCVWFFTAPIWSGIFVTFLLALILTWGITMIMDIRTMDRFDDPKGKTITISATE